MPPIPVTPLRPWLEQAWLQRYLDRELDAEESAWFEAHALDRPHLLAMIEADTALQHVLKAAPPEALGLPHHSREVADDEGAPVGKARVAPRPGWRMLALAASFVGGLGLAQLLMTPPSPSAPEFLPEAPPRLVYDLYRGGRVAPRQDAGDPRAQLIVVDIALPMGSRVQSAHAELKGQRIELPAAPVSAEGFATYALPGAWRGQARLHLALRDDGDQPLPPVELAL